MELVILSLSILALILFPAEGTAGAIEGLRLCGRSLIPALLPFLLITRLLAERLPMPKMKRKPFGISGSGWFGLLTSFIGGYPTGVATVVSLYRQNRISKKEAESLIPLCNNSGPGFFVGVLGAGLFGSVKTGLLLYGIHVITALWGIVVFPCSRGSDVGLEPMERLKKKSFPQVFQEALSDTCNTMVRICGLVILFSVFRGLLSAVLPSALMRYMGIVEVSSGLLTTGRADFVLWAVFMGWGGVCVHMQAMSLWQEAGLQIRGYFPRKILHGALSGLCAMALKWDNWYIVGIYFIICPVFSLFYEKWGRKNRRLAL